ncbi:MAG: 50S ribosomal protein L18 [bacterium]
MLANQKEAARRRRRLRIRSKVSGTPDRPRLSIHKSLKHLYIQVIDDTTGRTLVEVTTNTKVAKAERKTFSNIACAKTIGRQIGEKAAAAGIMQVVFDRGGYPYHGIVRAIAEAAREAGLKF